MNRVDSVAINSIDDVDRFVADNWEDVSLGATVKLNPFETRFWDQSLPHRRLLLMKSLFRASPLVNKRFAERRSIHLHAVQRSMPSSVHLRAYEKAFSEINRAHEGCFGRGSVKRFLDLGCSPGGFSTWLLKSNWGVQGVGITLPDDEARFPVQIDPELLARSQYQLRYDNVVTLAMEAAAAGKNPVIAPETVAPGGQTHPEPFDLVVANAHPMLTGRIAWWNRVQLALSQLLIIVSNVAPGGSGLMAINTKPFLWVVDIIGVLQQSFESVKAYKSEGLHAVRTVCYLVCRGFHASAEEVGLYTVRIRVALQHLEELRLADEAQLSQASDAEQSDAGSSHEREGSRSQKGRSPEDVPLISGASASDIFDARHRFVLDLFEPVWELQYNAIRADFADVLAGECTASSRSPVRAESDFRATTARTNYVGRNGGEQAKSPIREYSILAPPASPTASPWRPKRRSTMSSNTVGNDGWQTTTYVDGDQSYMQNARDAGFKDFFGRRRSQSSAADASTWWRNS